MERTDRAFRILDGAALFLFIVAFTYRGFVNTVGSALSSPSLASSHSTNFLAAGLFMVAATVWLLARFLEGKITIRRTGVEGWIFLLVLMGIVSMLGASFKLVAIEYVVSWGGLLVFFILVTHALEAERVSLGVRILLTLGVVLLAYALLQQIFLLDIARGSPQARILRETQAGRARLEEGLQPFATFTYQNTFAAFLVFFGSVVAGLIADAWRSGRRGVALLSPVLILAATLACLGLTLSKGGWVAAGAAAGCFVWWWTGRKWIPAVLLAAGIAGGWGLWGTASMQVRSVYWRAALRIAAEHPVRGVGLHNFQEHYAQFKGPEPEEVGLAHNDYLQILCELGIPGLMILAGIFFWCGRCLRVRREAKGPVPPARDSPWLPVSAIVTGLLLAQATENSFPWPDGGPWLALFLAVGAGMYFVLRSGKDAGLSEDHRGLRTGLAAGVAGVALHMAVDFDLYEHNLVVFLLFGVGLGALLGGRYRRFETGRLFAGFLAFLLSAVTGMFVLWPYGKLAAGEARQVEGRLAVQAYERSGDVDALQKSRHAFEAAVQENPWDPQLFADLAGLYRKVARRVKPNDPVKAGRAVATPDPEDEELARIRPRVFRYMQYMELAAAAFEKAIKLRPRNEALRGAASSTYLEHADFLRAVLPHLEDPGGRIRAELTSKYLLALRHARRAALLYPTRALIQYQLGLVLGRLDRLEEKAEAWILARRAHDRAVAGGKEDLQLSHAQLEEIDRFLAGLRH